MAYVGVEKRSWAIRGQMAVPTAQAQVRTATISHEKRRGRDSNPRIGYPITCFRDRLLQPLGHLSPSGRGRGRVRKIVTHGPIAVNLMRS
jgi:hypothetical protein